MFRKKTFYQILEVKSDVSDEELRKAFIKRSNELHPDGKDFKDSKKNTEKFMELKEAYDALKKPERRKEYDRELEFGRAAAREMFYEPVRYLFLIVIKILLSFNWWNDVILDRWPTSKWSS